MDRDILRWVWLCALALGGCGATPQAPVANEADPAIAEALNDPIMADPRLELQHGGGSISVPVGGEDLVPAVTLGQIAASRVREPAFAGCDAKITYAFAWMARVPAALALPRGATVSEAAGRDAQGCALRIVRYTIAQSPAAVARFYRKPGFALVVAESGTVRGVRARDGTAFWVSIKATQRGSAVDFVTNRGG